MDNLEELIHNFFKEYAGLEGLKDAAIVIARRDGVPLYAYKGFKSTWNESTASALISGMWQAAETLTQFIPTNENEDFRFSYETSTRGVFIVELKGNFDSLYLTYMYFNQDNPAKMKSRIRNLQNKLSLYIDENFEIGVAKQTSNDVFLFSNISDAEMDNLFAGVLN